MVWKFRTIIISIAMTCSSDCEDKKPASQARDKEAAKRLWRMSEELVHLKYDEVENK